MGDPRDYDERLSKRGLLEAMTRWSGEAERLSSTGYQEEWPIFAIARFRKVDLTRGY